MLILWEEEEDYQIFEAVKQAFFSPIFFKKKEEKHICTNFFLIKYNTKEIFFFQIFKIHQLYRGAKWRQTAKTPQFPVQNRLCAASMGVKINQNR